MESAIKQSWRQSLALSVLCGAAVILPVLLADNQPVRRPTGTYAVTARTGSVDTVRYATDIRYDAGCVTIRGLVPNKAKPLPIDTLYTTCEPATVDLIRADVVEYR